MNLLTALIKICKYVFVLCVFVQLTLLFTHPSLPAPEEVRSGVLLNDPEQTEVNMQPFGVQSGDFTYTVSPRYEYELYGLVVSEYESDNWLDITHKKDPKNIGDLCVVWGENIANGAYRKVSYSSGEFTCFYRWRGENPGFSSTHFANNHILPANEEIAEIAKTASIGDQIRIRGYLADYSIFKGGKQIFSQQTSTNREDTGNGACEIVYVTEVEIIEDAHTAREIIAGLSRYGAVGSFGLLIFLFFMSLLPKSTSRSLRSLGNRRA